MKIDKNIGFLFNKTSLKMKLLVQKVFADNGYPVTAEQWGVLQCLYEKDGLSQVELSTILEKDKPNITRILDVMEKNNLIVRQSDPSDRRKFLIVLTKKAKDMEDDILKLAVNCRGHILKGIPAEDLEKLIAVISKINENIDGVKRQI